MEREFGGFAFPQTDFLVDGSTANYGEAGMTLRDYFAAKAMQSVITQEIAALRRVNEYTAKSSEDVMAEWAYKMADAMLKKREQE